LVGWLIGRKGIGWLVEFWGLCFYGEMGWVEIVWYICVVFYLNLVFFLVHLFSWVDVFPIRILHPYLFIYSFIFNAPCPCVSHTSFPLPLHSKLFIPRDCAYSKGHR
jgi:hypothetical protein